MPPPTATLVLSARDGVELRRRLSLNNYIGRTGSRDEQSLWGFPVIVRESYQNDIAPPVMMIRWGDHVVNRSLSLGTLCDPGALNHIYEMLQRDLNNSIAAHNAIAQRVINQEVTVSSITARQRRAWTGDIVEPILPSRLKKHFELGLAVTNKRSRIRTIIYED